jgi:hypothetical protein
MNIGDAGHTMTLKSNGDMRTINEIADFEGFEKEVRFSTEAMTNLLFFALVRAEYKISYDGESFIVHRSVNEYNDMVFMPHCSRLHVYNPDDPHSLASYSFFETVESNMTSFTKRQLRYAGLVQNVQAGLAFLSNQDMKWALQSNLIKDCPLTVKDITTAMKVWGPSIAMLKGKTVRTTPPVVRQDVIEILKKIQECHRDVTLTIYIFFVNKIPFFDTYSLVICFLSVTHLGNRKIRTIFAALKAMCNYYLQQGFQVVFIKGDGKFAPL